MDTVLCCEQQSLILLVELTGKLPTDVVRTPHSSNFSNVGVGALGVSMNSNSDSLPVALCGLDILEVLRWRWSKW